MRNRPDVQSEMSRRAFLRGAGTSLGLAGVVGAGALAWQSSGRGPAPAAPSASAAPLLSATEPPSYAAVAKPPNVLLVTIDTLRADQLGSYGNSTVKTPALDAFAAQGARFAWHMVQQPQTNPSHASMLAGMYPSSSGVRVHMVDKIPANLQTLPKVFSAGGYATAGLFSWMSFDNQYCNFQPGFDVYQDLTNPASSLLHTPGVAELVAQHQTAVPHTDGLTPLERQETLGKGHADVTTAAAVAQLSAFGKQPFFMWLHYFDPHYPYQPPASYANLYDPSYSGPISDSITTIDAVGAGQVQLQPADVQRLMAYYQAEITYLDSQLQPLFQALDDTGLTDNTVVAVAGDHGESFGEHTQFDEGGAFFHPHTLFNTEQRVPLLLRSPGSIRGGTAVSSPTQAIDLFPTLIGLAGLKVPDQSQGQSVVGLLDGSEDGAARAAYAAMPDYAFTSIARPGWKLVRNVASGQQALFDLAHDPTEQHDVAGAHPNATSQLGGQLEAWMKRVHIS